MLIQTAVSHDFYEGLLNMIISNRFIFVICLKIKANNL